jgi:hypothetical protein
VSEPSNTPPATTIEAVSTEPTPEAVPAPRHPLDNSVLVAAAVAIVIVVIVIGATPFWAPSIMQLLPWGQPAAAPSAAPAPQPVAAKPSPPPAPVAANPSPAPDPGIAALRAEIARNDTASERLGQRIAALEGKPPPDLSAIQQQLAALGKTTSDLGAGVAALQKAAQAQPAADPRNTAMALVLLQIREAIDIGRPFATEYQALLGLTKDHPEIATAVAPLAEPATSGVASRAALTERLRQLAPRIATAAPPAQSGWRGQIVARLRGLVTIRRIEGDAQTPEEAAIGTAQRDMAGGDLDGAVAALSGLSGSGAAAAEPWLKMARQRLAVEAALRQLAAALTAALGAPG